MTTCPACRYQRKATDTAPEWQCPACGVAYAKVGSTANAAPRRTGSLVDGTRPPRSSGIAAWLLVGAVVVAGLWQVPKVFTDTTLKDGVEISTPPADMAQLAASVKPGEVVMYTTSTCGYCHQAKDWLNEKGFAFTECNTETDRDCYRQFRELGGRGVPLVVVRGRNLGGGFDPEEFVDALRS